MGCRAVVDAFTKATYAWELRWLAARPLAEQGLTGIDENREGLSGYGYRDRDWYAEHGQPSPRRSGSSRRRRAPTRSPPRRTGRSSSGG